MGDKARKLILAFEVNSLTNILCCGIYFPKRY